MEAQKTKEKSRAREANARNVRLYYPYWQFTDLFIFRFEWKSAFKRDFHQAKNAARFV